MILVDSSALIAFLRGDESPAAESLRQLEVEGVPFALPAVCYQEVLQGARDEREWRLQLPHSLRSRASTPKAGVDRPRRGAIP